eukprot:CAMPEP_0117050550 /NCGR_PEP_ID=MMETSP0472-20121206/34909_1 /TAXON_ID=693140 ORGANISM="Tiarina fusus, Strain LIS" /NCGR_SAMPLE_ID=MMETSP0472 /ASSEMBLY_ACC=CAM_ASM_000603 /LENGTH=35 /DNA_ID= /DNA_START= /DNA_END= /DNA_ORIENTATION=
MAIRQKENCGEYQFVLALSIQVIPRRKYSDKATHA